MWSTVVHVAVLTTAGFRNIAMEPRSAPSIKFSVRQRQIWAWSFPFRSPFSFCCCCLSLLQSLYMACMLYAHAPCLPHGDYILTLLVGQLLHWTDTYALECVDPTDGGGGVWRMGFTFCNATVIAKTTNHIFPAQNQIQLCMLGAYNTKRQPAFGSFHTNMDSDFALRVAIVYALHRRQQLGVRRFRVHPILQRRSRQGEYHALVQELRLDAVLFKKFFRMTREKN